MKTRERVLRVGMKVSAFRSKRFGLPNRPCAGVVLSFETRKSKFGETTWAKVAWTDVEGNGWEDFAALQDLGYSAIA